MIRFLLPLLIAIQSPVVAQTTSIQAEVDRAIAEVSQLTLPPKLAPLSNAFVAAEDRFFYQRSPSRSIITRQLVNVLFGELQLSPTLSSAIAIVLGQSLSRDQILAAYLQGIYLGKGCYGIENGSLAILGKTLSELSPSDHALLAALPKAPNLFLSKPERWVLRANSVLLEMAEMGILTAADAENYNIPSVTDLPKPTLCNR